MDVSLLLSPSSASKEQMGYPFFEVEGGSELEFIYQTIYDLRTNYNTPPSDEHVAGKAITILQLALRHFPRSKEVLRPIFLQHLLEDQVLQTFVWGKVGVNSKDFVSKTGET
ncbi:predicted protein [Sclerotinia sclerotiorum 1980 UF-70]|uniref:Uncharacterized protein n=2 Tax=Sclerotinia sclerotiorum (strain ATCC 18683 / 1980 / Ss-1) TaxID=665079 RepID=A7EQU8_SCLS1|nr:predicted protein [Sclerotinia sclerotiorum 1980 UF-70]APA13640.1 hypothetical protein sscle_11g084100 [Sclerotinia sclerotiorum 1980 UF-70]EDN91840.1 predicted protein [Sclerotinia sclerotiorum 1980 UF-70]